VRRRPMHMLAVEVLVERRPTPPAAEARLRPPRVVARLCRRRRPLERLRPVHMLAVEVLVERRPQPPAAGARLRRVMARFRCRRRRTLRRRPVQMVVVEALPVPRVSRRMLRRGLLRSLLPRQQPQLGLLPFRCALRPSACH
jgi:hypothetical protein